MRTILVVVNKQRIENGMRFDALHCPVALAISAHKGFYGAAVDRQTVYISGKYHLVGGMPKEAKKFIDRFDAGNKVKPIKFKLRFNEY